jgi:hypothetical protein
LENNYNSLDSAFDLTQTCQQIEDIYLKIINLWNDEVNNDEQNQNEIDVINKGLCCFCSNPVSSNNGVEFHLKTYHVSCINFWLNCVDSNTIPNVL